MTTAPRSCISLLALPRLVLPWSVFFFFNFLSIFFLVVVAATSSSPQPPVSWKLLAISNVPSQARPASLIPPNWGMVPHPLALGRFGSVWFGLGIRAWSGTPSGDMPCTVLVFFVGATDMGSRNGVIVSCLTINILYNNLFGASVFLLAVWFSGSPW